jgi:hypothetical protein
VWLSGSVDIGSVVDVYDSHHVIVVADLVDHLVGADAG